MASITLKKIEEETARRYITIFARMWSTNNLNPLCPGQSEDNYYVRKAALYYGAYSVVSMCVKSVRAAQQAGDQDAVSEHYRKLSIALDRIEPALRRDPPSPPGVLPWNLPPSRYRLQAPDLIKRRGENSKKHDLELLKSTPNWTDLVWAEIDPEWPYRDGLAASLLVPLRPIELIPGHRPAGYSPGVVVSRAESDLEISFMPAKSHAGLFGTVKTTVKLDPLLAGDVACYLFERCGASPLVVTVSSEDGFRKALAVVGKRALPMFDPNVSPYLIRHQMLADLKVTLKDARSVAAASGHGSLRSQHAYADARYGRQRAGYKEIRADRAPKSRRRKGSPKPSPHR